MCRRNTTTVLHLYPARAAFAGGKRGFAGFQRMEKICADCHTDIVFFSLETVTPGNATASCIHVPNFDSRYHAQKIKAVTPCTLSP